MTAPVRKGYRDGTHRACPPEETLERVRPALAAAGVTRIADITGLDRVGIPVFCAIRPRGRILQTTNGKGLRAVDARVSAAMEALEHSHCEVGPPAGEGAPDRDGGAPLATPRLPAADLPAGRTAVDPAALPLADPAILEAAPAMRWLQGTELLSGGPVWIPAPACHAEETPRAFAFSTNGLASGNTLEEATLHAVYEVLERDTVTRRVRGGRLRLDAAGIRRVRPDSVDAPGPAALLERIHGAGLRASLLHLEAPGDVCVFWAALLDPDPFHPCTRVNFGYGAHLSPEVAAVRALTEAAQTRLSYIHGVREDLGARIRAAREPLVRPVFEAFDAVPERLGWGELDDRSTDRLDRDLERLLDAVREAGFGAVHRADLTRRDPGIPVVKVLVPGAAMDRRLF